jgi:vacuolar-type H+-ATPase subunit I/STV1
LPLSVRNKKKNNKEEVQKEIDQLEKEIEEIKNTENSVREFTGKAFVAWDKQSEAESLLVKFERSWFRKLINFFIFKIFRIKGKNFHDTRWWEE